MQFKRKGKDEPIEFSRIGSIYQNLEGRINGIIDLNVADETPKGDDRFLNFILIDPYKANNLRNRQYMGNNQQEGNKNYKR